MDVGDFLYLPGRYPGGSSGRARRAGGQRVRLYGLLANVEGHLTFEDVETFILEVMDVVLEEDLLCASNCPRVMADQPRSRPMRFIMAA
jgi:hypothetical protein